MDPPGEVTPGAWAPSEASLAALGSDAWALVLPVVRRVLAAPPHAADPRGERLRSTPTSRLVSGPRRDALCRWLATDPTLWAAVADGLRALPEPPAELAAVLDGPEPDADERSASASDGPDRELVERLRDRLRDARDERDVWRRRAEGADARAEQLARQVTRLETETAELDARLRAADAALSEASTQRARAVEREARRRDAEVAGLERQLASLRRVEEERRTQQRRRAEARRQVARDAQRAAADTSARTDEEASTRVVPGRPSRLPRGVALGTTEAARALLHRGRRVFVDGYNVTKQHRGHLDLEMQRTWLVQQTGVLARRTGVVPTVVFDGQERGGSRPPSGLRDVEVRFTDAGITADDELVLAVEATDAPVVVVTDDRDLVERVRASGADVVDTRSFVGVLS